MSTTDQEKQEPIDAAMELMETFKVTKIERRAWAGAGSWVTGTMGGHRFDAMVFPQHATCDDYELEKSRISKLSLRRIEDRRIVVSFDRGWDVRPTTEVEQMIVDLLCEGLADFTYDPQQM